MEILKQRNTLHSLLDVIWLQAKPIILQDLPRRNLLTPIIWQNLMRSIHEIFILCPNQTWDLLTTSIVQNKFPLTSKAEKVFFPTKFASASSADVGWDFSALQTFLMSKKGLFVLNPKPICRTFINIYIYNQNQYFKSSCVCACQKSINIKFPKSKQPNTHPSNRQKAICPKTARLISINHKHGQNEEAKRDLICFCIRTNRASADRGESRQRGPWPYSKSGSSYIQAGHGHGQRLGDKA